MNPIALGCVFIPTLALALYVFKLMEDVRALQRRVDEDNRTRLKLDAEYEVEIDKLWERIERDARARN